MATEPQQPSSWRDVYTLVRDTRADLLSEVAGVREEISGLRAKVDTHLLSHATEHAVDEARYKARNSALNNLRNFIMTVLPIPTAVLALAAILGFRA